jgi:hypothetical protein
MRIINRANGCETTLGAAVSICDDDPTALRDMVTRLLEELCFNADGTQVLRAASLSRILAYGFRVED